MTTQCTYEQIADDYSLWTQYVDTSGEMTKDEFDALTVEQKIKLQTEAFGAENA